MTTANRSAASGIATQLKSPIVIILSIVAGGYLGFLRPDIGQALSPLGDTYLGLLKLIVLPFIVSSIIFSLRDMVGDHHSSRYLPRMFANVAVVSVLAVVISAAVMFALKPGYISDLELRAQFGKVVGSDEAAFNSNMTLVHSETDDQVPTVLDRILEVIPTNVFVSLVEGNTVQVLVFAILFGFALGSIPFEASSGLASSLNAVYRACMTLTQWFLLMLPFGSFAMVASQTATMGFEPLVLMINFMVALSLITAIFVIGSLCFIAWRAKVSVYQALRQHSQMLFMAITTRSSVACIPLIIDLLVSRLKFNKSVVELVVPLQTVLLRAGSIINYVMGPIFIAQLYERDLQMNEILLIGLYAIILGLTTAGMSGLVALSQLSIICGVIGLPFEAAFVLFVAVDTVSDVLRTLVLVITISAATAAVAPLEQGEPSH